MSKPLKIRNFTKKYGHSVAVDDINLDIEEGEIFGFLGPNGAGKSTTIRSIMDFIRPTSGQIQVFGLDSIRDSHKIHAQVGYLAGDVALYNQMTGKQLFKFLTSIGQKTDWSLVDELSDLFEADLSVKISDLSKGNRQKIGLIQAFMHRPKLLILDEPTSGLDPLVKQSFYKLIRKTKEQGSTLFLSSHDLNEVQKVCDRAAFIRQGQIVAVEDIGAEQHSTRRYLLKFSSKPPAQLFAKVSSVKAEPSTKLSMIVTVSGDASEFITELAKFPPVSLEEQEISLEDQFMHYYQDKTRGKEAT